jgi:hypothetical protein
VRLLLDHHYPNAVAIELRRRRHDVETAFERNVHWVSDETLLTVMAEDGRAVLTNNVRDYVRILHRWATHQGSHAGVIFTSDRSLPRNAGGVGALVSRLDELLAANPSDDAFVDRIHWL